MRMIHKPKKTLTKHKVMKSAEKGIDPTYADWMDQDDVGEDLKGWTPTGFIGPVDESRPEMTGEDRPGWTQSEERFMEQEEEDLPPNED